MNRTLTFRPEPFPRAANANPATGAFGMGSEGSELEEENLFEGFDLGESEWDAEISRGHPDYIRWVQSGLNKVLGLRLAEDGILGLQTRSAVRSFQANNGLAPDGVVGPQTEKALMAKGVGNPPGSGLPSHIPTYPSVRPPAATPSISTSFIAIRSGVKLTQEIEKVVRELDAYFRTANLPVTLTSGYRTPEDQLRIIRDQSIRRGISRKYPSIKTATVDNVASWLDAWDELLNREKYIVNPPKDACSRITGKCYQPSPHTRGVAFDLSGANLDSIAGVVRDYCRRGGAISQILVERTNNAVHVGVGPRNEC